MLHGTVVNSIDESLAMNLSFMLPCCTSLVVLALLSMLPFSLACEGDNSGANCDEHARTPRDVSCGPVQCLNGGTCESMATEVGESSTGISGSAIGPSLVIEGEAPVDMVCACATGYTGSNCSGIYIYSYESYLAHIS
jgi:hypothetical protein